MIGDYPKHGPLTLRSHLGDRPATRGVFDGSVTSALVTLHFQGPKNVASGFKPLLRERAFDVSELSIMTYLQARELRKPVVLLPAVVLARFQHAYLVSRRGDGAAAPRDLVGRRVGARSFTVTTVCWIQAILRLQYGIDPLTVTWVTHEDSHIAEFSDPPNVERIALNGRTLEQMVADGELDAAVLAEPTTNPQLKTVIADPEAAARDWFARFGALQLNHLVIVASELAEQRPDAVLEIYRLLARAKEKAGPTGPRDFTPFGVAANRRNLEIAIDCALAQGLISRRFEVEELFPANLVDRFDQPFAGEMT